MDSDIAIIEVDNPVQWTEHVALACLPSDPQASNVEEGQVGLVSCKSLN